jgi:predicted DNA-binding protein (MmcQ/YjbR family)
MDLATLHAYLLDRPGAIEDRPFGPEIPVYRVMGKMFAYILPKQVPPWLTLKLDPAAGQLARSTHASVRAGYHMNKEHWNTVILDGSVPETEIMAWIDESYDLVVAGLTRAKREELRGMCEEADG